MKTFVKVLVAILIVIGLCFGVYAVLPQTSKMFVKGNIQYRTDCLLYTSAADEL